MLEEILTIGVYGFDENVFYDALASHRVDVLCDVRGRRGVRGSAYAFANHRQLVDGLERRGIRYLHLRELAPTMDMRNQQREADRLSGERKRDRGHLADSFVEAFTGQILARQNSDHVIGVICPLGSRVVFLCVERSPEACHRSLVANWLCRKLCMNVVHIVP